jgi:hypothetical protein
MRLSLLIGAAIPLAVVAACSGQARQEETDTTQADCIRMMEENPQMMQGMMQSVMSDSTRHAGMMRTMMQSPSMRRMMMRRMMEDPQMHGEMMRMMGGMQGREGMRGMGGAQGMEGMGDESRPSPKDS